MVSPIISAQGRRPECDGHCNKKMGTPSRRASDNKARIGGTMASDCSQDNSPLQNH